MAWTLSGATHEGEAWLRRVLENTEHLQTPERARVFVKLGGLEHMLGNVKEAEKVYEEAGRCTSCTATSEGRSRLSSASLNSSR
jgi:hypothetical protein